MADELPASTGPLRASIETSMGTIVVQLLEDEAPQTVANFVAQVGRPQFDGTRFHRVIPNFMIETGENDPDLQLAAEPATARRFDHPGLVATANIGSQWFITEVATPHLNRRHTIFGEVMKGFEIVPKIARKPADAAGLPLEPIVIRHVSISRGGA